MTVGKGRTLPRQQRGLDLASHLEFPFERLPRVGLADRRLDIRLEIDHHLVEGRSKLANFVAAMDPRHLNLHLELPWATFRAASRCIARAR